MNTMNFEIAPKSTEIKANWYDAKLYCFSLNIDGKTGWRLPTKEELNEIYESVNDFEKAWYWSSTEFYGSYAWYQGFGSGSQSYDTKNDGGDYVRAIRSIT
jgi:hypothetical protein